MYPIKQMHIAMMTSCHAILKYLLLMAMIITAKAAVLSTIDYMLYRYYAKIIHGFDTLMILQSFSFKHDE